MTDAAVSENIVRALANSSAHERLDLLASL